MEAFIVASNTGWVVGYTLGVIVVLVVVALVVPILFLAHRIGQQAETINTGLGKAVTNTAALADLSTTVESADAIVQGLKRGRTTLGG